jgi:hypothetical protein
MGPPGALDVFLKMVEHVGLPATTGFIGLLAWMWERKQNLAMQSRLMDLAAAQIQAAAKVEMALEAIKSVLVSTRGKK